MDNVSKKTNQNQKQLELNEIMLKNSVVQKLPSITDYSVTSIMQQQQQQQQASSQQTILTFTQRNISPSLNHANAMSPQINNINIGPICLSQNNMTNSHIDSFLNNPHESPATNSLYKHTDSSNVLEGASKRKLLFTQEFMLSSQTKNKIEEDIPNMDGSQSQNSPVKTQQQLQLQQQQKIPSSQQQQQQSKLQQPLPNQQQQIKQQQQQQQILPQQIILLDNNNNNFAAASNQIQLQNSSLLFDIDIDEGPNNNDNNSCSIGSHRVFNQVGNHQKNQGNIEQTSSKNNNRNSKLSKKQNFDNNNINANQQRPQQQILESLNYQQQSIYNKDNNSNNMNSCVPDNNNINNNNYSPDQLNRQKQDYSLLYTKQRQLVWKKKSLFIIAAVSRFISKMRKRVLVFRRPQLLSMLQLNAISDRAAPPETKYSGNFLFISSNKHPNNNNKQGDQSQFQKTNTFFSSVWGSGNTTDFRKQLLQQQRLKQIFGKYVKKFKILKKKFRQSCSFIYQLYSMIQYIFHKCFNFLGEALPVFNPLDRLLIVWQASIQIIILLTCIYLPFRLSFSRENYTEKKDEIDISNNQQLSNFFEIWTPILLAVDILVQANTVFFQQGLIVKQHSAIVLRYLGTPTSSLFLADLIAILALKIALPSNSIFSILFLHKLFIPKEFIKNLSDNLIAWPRIHVALKFLRLLLQLIFLCHLLACLWHYIGSVEKTPNRMNIDNEISKIISLNNNNINSSNTLTFNSTSNSTVTQIESQVNTTNTDDGLFNNNNTDSQNYTSGNISDFKGPLSQSHSYNTITNSTTTIADTSIFTYPLNQLVKLLLLFVSQDSSPSTASSALFQDGMGWLSRLNLFSNSTQSLEYANAFYMMVLCLSSSQGYQMAQTLNEKIFVIALSFLSFAVLAYVINSVRNLLKQLNPHEKQLKRKLQLVNHYFQGHSSSEIDPQLKLRTVQYLNYYYSQHNPNTTTYGYVNQDIDIDKELNCLSKYLLEEIKQKVNKNVLCGVDILRQNFSSKFLLHLALKVRDQVYSKHELILRDSRSLGQPPCLYIVRQGEVEAFLQVGKSQYYNEEEVRSLSFMGPQQCFGELEFFAGLPTPQLSYRCSAHTTYVSKVLLSDFLDLLEDFPEDRERFCAVRDRLILQHDYSCLKMCCASCLQSSHLTRECPYLFYGQIKPPILKKIIIDQKKMMNSFKRRRRVIGSGDLLAQSRNFSLSNQFNYNSNSINQNKIININNNNNNIINLNNNNICNSLNYIDNNAFLNSNNQPIFSSNYYNESANEINLIQRNVQTNNNKNEAFPIPSSQNQLESPSPKKIKPRPWQVKKLQNGDDKYKPWLHLQELSNKAHALQENQREFIVGSYGFSNSDDDDEDSDLSNENSHYMKRSQGSNQKQKKSLTGGISNLDGTNNKDDNYMYNSASDFQQDSVIQQVIDKEMNKNLKKIAQFGSSSSLTRHSQGCGPNDLKADQIEDNDDDEDIDSFRQPENVFTFQDASNVGSGNFDQQKKINPQAMSSINMDKAKYFYDQQMQQPSSDHYNNNNLNSDLVDQNDDSDNTLYKLKQQQQQQQELQQQQQQQQFQMTASMNTLLYPEQKSLTTRENAMTQSLQMDQSDQLMSNVASQQQQTHTKRKKSSVTQVTQRKSSINNNNNNILIEQPQQLSNFDNIKILNQELLSILININNNFKNMSNLDNKLHCLKDKINDSTNQEDEQYKNANINWQQALLNQNNNNASIGNEDYQFGKIQQFTYYFPQNNLDNILSSFTQKQKLIKKISKRKISISKKRNQKLQNCSQQISQLQQSQLQYQQPIQPQNSNMTFNNNNQQKLQQSMENNNNNNNANNNNNLQSSQNKPRQQQSTNSNNNNNLNEQQLQSQNSKQDKKIQKQDQKQQ